MASEHTLDTTHATVPPVGPTNQLHAPTRPNRASQTGAGHSPSPTFYGRQTGVRRKIPVADAAESRALDGRDSRDVSEQASTTAPLSACVAALDASSDAVLILDRSGVVQYVNRACMTLLARERSDQRLVGRHALGLVCLDGAAIKNILRALQHAQVWNGTLQVELGTRCRAVDLCVCRVAGRSGRTQSFSVIARPARVDSGSSQNMHTDNAQGADVLSTIARVASEMAHDFNNQLAVVLNYSFILLRELPSRSPMRSHVTELQGAAWRAAEVAREVLRFGARRSVDASEIDVHQLLRTTQAILAPMLGGGQTKVELRLAAESCHHVVARRAQLEWLVFELSARLQSRLGRLASLRISTSNALSGNKSEHGGPRVLIAVEAHPAQSGPREHVIGQKLGDESCAHTAERMLEQANGELTLHVLPDGGLRYLVCMPAARA